MLTGWGGPVTGSEAPRDHQHGTASWWPREAATSQTESVFTPYVGGRVTLTGCWGTGWAGGAGACTRRGDCPPRLPPQASGLRSSMPGGREASTGTARPPGPAGTSHECADRGRPVGSRGPGVRDRTPRGEPCDQRERTGLRTPAAFLCSLAALRASIRRRSLSNFSVKESRIS